MRILSLVRGNHQIVFETLQIEKSYDKLECWSGPFKLRMWMITKAKISATKVENSLNLFL